MNETGHMAVARIAWDNMTPATQRAVTTLLRDPKNPNAGYDTTAIDSDPFTAACWMDDFKQEARKAGDKNTEAKLHFDNIPIGDRAQGQKDITPNAITCLKQQTLVLQDPNAGNDQRAEALRDVMHLVGDMHQPLHCVNRFTADFPKGDSGGNKVNVTWLPGHPRFGNDLHAIWDDGGAHPNPGKPSEAEALFKYMKRPLTGSGERSLTLLASTIEKQYPSKTFTVTQLNDLNPQDWSNEGKDIAEKVAYVGIENGQKLKPNEPYLAKVQDTMMRQTALAGYRLANLLNQTLGDATRVSALPPGRTGLRPETARPHHRATR